MAVGEGIAVHHDRADVLLPLRRRRNSGEKPRRAIAPVFQQQGLLCFRKRVKPAAGKQLPVMRAGDDKQVGIACGETVGAEAGDQRAKPVLPAQRFIDGKAFEQLSRRAAAAEQPLIGRENAKRTLDVVLQLQAVRMQKLLERFPLGQKGKLQRADLIVLHKYLPARISKKRPVSALPAGRRLCASFN